MNVTLIVQVPNAAIVGVQSSVSANWLLLIVIPDTLSGAFELFVTLTVCAALLLPTGTAVNDSSSGERVGGNGGGPPATGVPVALGDPDELALPIPISSTDCGLVGVSVKPSLSVSVPV